MQTLKQELRASVPDVKWMALCIGIGYGFGVVLMVWLAKALMDVPEYFDMGLIFGLLGLLVGVTTRRNLNPHIRLRLAVGMGETRRAFLAADAVITALETLVCLGVLFLLGRLELGLYRLIEGDGMVLTVDIMDIVYRWQVVVAITVGMAIFNFFITALCNRFGIKGYLVMWLPWCLINPIVTPAIHAAQSGSRSILALLGHGVLWVIDTFSPVPWQVLVAAGLFLLLVIGWLLTRRCEVRL